jgi:hypothetical protein
MTKAFLAKYGAQFSMSVCKVTLIQIDSLDSFRLITDRQLKFSTSSNDEFHSNPIFEFLFDQAEQLGELFENLFTARVFAI